MQRVQRCHGLLMLQGMPPERASEQGRARERGLSPTLPARAAPRAACSSALWRCSACSCSRRSPKPFQAAKHCAHSSGLRAVSHTQQPCSHPITPALQAARQASGAQAPRAPVGIMAVTAPMRETLGGPVLARASMGSLLIC